MSGIDREIELLFDMSASGELPGYPASGGENTFYSENADSADMAEYFSGENDSLERGLEALWADEPEMKKCIPLILAAVEKSRGREMHAVVRTELYNYTM